MLRGKRVIVELPGRVFTGIQLEIVKFVHPVFFHGSKGNAQMLLLTVYGRIQTHNVRRNLPGGVGSQYHFYGGLPLRPGLYILYRKAADIQRISHGLCEAIVEIYLNTFLIIVGRGKNKPPFNHGILLHDRVKFTVCDFNTNS
jgi:hypothetical protein